MKLSPRDRSVLHHAQLQADQPVSVLRQSMPFQEHSIRYALQQARRNEVIRSRCFMDLCRLGYSQFEIFFSLSGSLGENGPEFIEALRASDRVSFFGELGGDYQYGVNICAKNLREVSDFFDQLSERYGEIFLEKAIAARMALFFFGNKYLANEPRKVEFLHYRVRKETVEIDEIDQSILYALSNTDFPSRRQLARELEMPLSTLEYRIKRLEERKVIVGYYNHFDPSKIGMQSYLLLVCVKGISRALKDSFFEFCKSHPNIVVLIHCLGNWDFEIVVDVADSNGIIAVTHQVREELGVALHFVKVLPFFSYLKVAEYPFQPEESQAQRAPRIANS